MLSSTKIGFLIDYTGDSGKGHLARCLNLVKALRNSADIYFFSQKQIPAVFFEGYIHTISSIVVSSNENNLSEMLSNIYDNGTNHWLIFDSYLWSRHVLKNIRSKGVKTLLIEDGYDLNPAAIVCLVQSPVKSLNIFREANGYLGGTILSGLDYILFDPALRTISRVQRESIEVIGISFGGSDQDRRIEETLQRLPWSSKKLKRVIAICFNPNSKIFDEWRDEPNLELRMQSSNLISFYEQVDLIIGSVGVSSFERLFLKIPSLVEVTAPNQTLLADMLHDLGVHSILDPEKDSIIKEDLFSVARLKFRAHMKSSVLQFDGFGVDRIAQVLDPDPARDHWEVQPATIDDEILLYLWVNDPGARRYAQSNEMIEYRDHRKWFTERIEDQNTEIFIIKTDLGVPVGYVRFEYRNHRWELSYYLAPSFRGLRLSGELLSLGVKKFSSLRRVEEVIAKVSKNNIVSLSCLLSFGAKLKRWTDNQEFCELAIDL